MIRLIASDLDGTLIPEGTQEMEPGFMETLARLLDRGYEFYAASGRQYANMYRRFGALSDRMGFVCENGALAIEGGRQLYRNEIPRERMLAIAEDILSVPEADICISGVETCYLRPRTDWFDDQMRNVLQNDCTFLKSLQEIAEPVVKLGMYVYDFPKNAPRLKAFFEGRYGEYADFVNGGNGWLDMIPKGTGKGQALRAVMVQKGLAPDEIMVFGDNQNDISMLSLTPNSYAMAHAAEDIRACAAHTCRSVTEVLQTLLNMEDRQNGK